MITVEVSTGQTFAIDYSSPRIFFDDLLAGKEEFEFKYYSRHSGRNETGVVTLNPAHVVSAKKMPVSS